MSDDVSADLAAAFEAQEPKTEVKPESKPEPAESQVVEPTAEAEPEAEEAKEEPKDERKPLRAPEGLKPEFKVRFAELDPEWQEEILRREQDAARGINELSEKAKLAKELDRTIAPYEPMIATMGVGKAELVQNMLQTAYVLNMGTAEQKAAVVRGIMDQYGVQVDQPAAEEVDPKIAELNTKISKLEQMLGQQPANDQAVRHEAATELQQFAADPANEFFGDVRVEMGKLIQAGVAADLKDAYDKACQLNPEIRKALSIRQQQAANLEKAREAKAAKAAAKQVSGSGVAEERKGAHDDPRDDLRALLEKQLG